MKPNKAGVAKSLRVAAIWGETVLGSTILREGEPFSWQNTLGLTPPEGIPEEPIRSAGGSWEVDPRGALGGFLRMRGRDEDVGEIARIGAPVGLMPGDVALLQYGAFALFAQPVADAPVLPSGVRFEPWIVMAIALSVVSHGGLLYALMLLSTPMPIPEPLELLSDRKLQDQLGVRTLEDEKEKPKSGDDAKGSGVKDPGLKDKKDAGGGKKIAGAEGKLGKHDKGDTHLPGETPGVPVGSMSDVIGSGAGAALTDTLNSMKSVSAIAGGLNAKDLQWGDGGGFAFKGTGSGGGGKDGNGVPYGSGGFNTGVGPGTGGGGGKGSGGAGGKGTGGSGTGGNGTPGEKKVAMVSSGGGGGKGFSADEIRRVVMSHLGQVRACYESALDASPGLKGSVTIAWHISGSGAVPRATVASSTLNNGRVEGCITRVVKGWTFKNPEGVEADASWGFGLTPPG